MSAEEQFRLLLKILAERRLTHPPHDPTVSGNIAFDEAKSLCSNQLILPQMVCFADIPEASLGVHVRKYSPFGLAFDRSKLVQLGAAPVRYVPIQHAPVWESLGREVVKEALSWPISAPVTGDPRERERTFRRKDMTMFTMRELFGFVKFYDPTLPADHEENYYYEREWRVVGNVAFELTDVRKVFVPVGWEDRFRDAFPCYAGEVRALLMK